MSTPEALAALQALVEAHAVPHERTGSREWILYVRYLGGAHLQHHGFDGPPPEVDEALLEEMAGQGVIEIDYRDSAWQIRPTAIGRRMIEQFARVSSTEPAADLARVLESVEMQSGHAEPLSWPAVRPVLHALRKYWEAGGFNAHGVQLPAVFEEIAESRVGLFVATVRALVDGDYLRQTTDLAFHDGLLPVEVDFTDRARAMLDGWPGADPKDLVENLLAVLEAQAAAEPDDKKKRRLKQLADSVRELGVSVTSEILKQVLLGGAG